MNWQKSGKVNAAKKIVNAVFFEWAIHERTLKQSRKPNQESGSMNTGYSYGGGGRAVKIYDREKSL